MSNPLKILRTLDKNLNHKVSLVVFGRAAIALGFGTPPPGAVATSDVDGIIPLHQVDTLEKDVDFWVALEKTNDEMESNGLYMTHLFQEDQVILTPQWFNTKIPLSLGLENIEIYRPSTVDLILTKTMRGDDPQDMEDIRFLIAGDKIMPEVLQAAFASASVPDVHEIRESFIKAQPIILSIAKELSRGP